MAGTLAAETCLQNATQLLELAVQTEDERIRNFLADCAADFMGLAAANQSDN